VVLVLALALGVSIVTTTSGVIAMITLLGVRVYPCSRGFAKGAETFPLG
jgi:hypothetical protein